MIVLPIAHRAADYRCDPRTIIGVGLNYREHIAEHLPPDQRGGAVAIPAEPILFAMTPNVLIASGAPIVLPRFIEDYGFDEPRTEHEAELAFIVKDHCKDVPENEALDHILGYTCFNDVSQRNFQRGDRSGWFRGKSLDSFGPVGPVVVLAEDLPDPQDLDITCRVNGQVRQHSNTRHMIFSVATLLAFISRNITLQPGDVVATGTPSGVGLLEPGDVVEVEIGGIGVLRNPVVAEGRA